MAFFNGNTVAAAVARDRHQGWTIYVYLSRPSHVNETPNHEAASAKNITVFFYRLLILTLILL